MPAGRPTKFKQDMLADAESLCSMGFTEEQLAIYWHVNQATLYRWKKRNPEFSNAVERGKIGRNVSATQALLDLVKGKNLSAIIFWLTNRCPELWADKRAVFNNTNVLASREFPQIIYQPVRPMKIDGTVDATESKQPPSRISREG